jgi:hypothetical protein
MIETFDVVAIWLAKTIMIASILALAVVAWVIAVYLALGVARMTAAFACFLLGRAVGVAARREAEEYDRREKGERA